MRGGGHWHEVGSHEVTHRPWLDRDQIRKSPRESDALEPVCRAALVPRPLRGRSPASTPGPAPRSTQGRTPRTRLLLHRGTVGPRRGAGRRKKGGRRRRWPKRKGKRILLQCLFVWLSVDVVILTAPWLIATHASLDCRPMWSCVFLSSHRPNTYRYKPTHAVISRPATSQDNQSSRVLIIAWQLVRPSPIENHKTRI
jgi:hypothetical protein